MQRVRYDITIFVRYGDADDHLHVMAVQGWSLFSIYTSAAGDIVVVMQQEVNDG